MAIQLSETMPDVPKANRELILFVDDEEVIREVTAQLLEFEGYEVITAKNGAEALLFIGNRPHEIKLLITDLVMPILSGEELLRSAKRLHPE
jgi:CheY-like chemotaxis protein